MSAAEMTLPLLRKAPGSTPPPLNSNTHIGVVSAKKVRKKQRGHFVVDVAGVASAVGAKLESAATANSDADFCFGISHCTPVRAVERIYHVECLTGVA